MKKLWLGLLAMMLCLAFVACNAQEPQPSGTQQPSTSTTPGASVTPGDTTPNAVLPSPTPNVESEKILAQITKAYTEDGVNYITVEPIEAKWRVAGDKDADGKTYDEDFMEITPLEGQTRTIALTDEITPFLFISDPSSTDVAGTAASVDWDSFKDKCTVNPAFGTEYPQYFDITIENGKASSIMLWMTLYVS